jgi:hypothetical protein
MTVKAIMAKLSRCNPDDEVFVFDPGIKDVMPIQAVGEVAGSEDKDGVVIYMGE